VYYRIERNDELINAMIEYATEFWFGNVEAQVEPPVTERDTELLNKLYSNSDPSKTVEFDGNDDAVLVRDLLHFKERYDVAKQSKGAAENVIKDRMKEAETLMFQGKVVATWKADKNGKRTFKVK
jgi:predicted phage-related endonuclease